MFTALARAPVKTCRHALKKDTGDVSPASAWFVHSIAWLPSKILSRESTLLRIDISAVRPFLLQIFNALNSLDLKSLEEPRYLLGEFVKQPLACLTLGEPHHSTLDE